MVKKRGLWLLAAALIAIFGVAFAVMSDKVSVSASSIALAEQGWRANFSSELHPDAIKKGDLYITDSEGNPVNAEMALLENGKTIDVPELSVGEYKLHIKESAIKGGFLKSLSASEVSFVVQEKLQKLSNAEELEAYFEQLMVLEKNSGQPGLFNNAESAATEESADSSSASGSGGEEHSTTNNQVEGVDEADLVKTDGSYIYAISEAKVVITDVRNPEAMTVAKELAFKEEMYPQQLFLSDNVLVVLGSKYHIMPMEGDVLEYRPQTALTSVYLYNIEDPENPSLIREFGTEGNLNGARLTENILYFVTNMIPNYHILEEPDDGEIRPHVYDSKNGEAIQPLPYEKIAILPGTMAANYSIITAIDLAEPEKNEVKTEGYLGGSEQLYMTKDHLYVTASAYMPISEKEDEKLDMSIWLPQQTNTKIFKFALDGAEVEFEASAEVTGSLLNQFSMDEFNGYFRVATTEGFVWDEAAPSKNHLYVLDDKLTQVGSVEDLAPGERIYSARFIGDKAYMVTFKETDPLFVIDVSTPTAPKVLGELKIPGFSNYLHPLGDNHLIGFGYDTKLEPVKNGEPRVVTGGMKISLFDITDFANPLEKDTEIIGGAGTYSTLQYDHKALFTHADKSLYGFPVSIFREATGDYVEFEGAGAMIYTITPEGIEETANLLNERDAEFENWETSVQRILYIGDSLYTVSPSEVKSYNLDTFDLKDTVSYK
ncbi:beta-propeller domain-containing protein [Planococcus sp. N028]|uniref:Beta-propeller domain-containing protein n=1 Tax=Planococcus shixiaomingii TaxID=3058393 RepID=A0ABT8N1W9_9BACL|nr:MULTISPECIES: beta-propeller domain-containing protein [unclassified Planococcus (in: firmicutes)]MDN7241890.1 beta-propeller domain-containing protein [Planococcus sp. N028]WKA54175.1 beta-propeller domain-containing protein [Planococcus sp. N022]